MTSTAAATTTTVTTATYTVVGTTPSGSTVTQTTTQVTTTPPGPDGIALQSGAPLAAPSAAIQGQTIDRIQCNRLTQLAYQAYAHLQVYVDGRPRAVPGAIGLVTPRASSTGTITTYYAGLCSYWLGTTTTNGLIKVRSPLPRTYTLGELFDIWGRTLGRHQVAGERGPVTASVNGRPWHGNPRAIPLREHNAIELAVGQPVPRPRPVDWSMTTL